MEELELNDRTSWPRYSLLDSSDVMQESSDYGQRVTQREEKPGTVPRKNLRRRGARPDRVDIMRSWAVIIAGGLLGVLLIGGVFFLLQPGSRPFVAPPTATLGSHTPTPDARGNRVQGGNIAIYVGVNNDALPLTPVVSYCLPGCALQALYSKTLTLSSLKTDRSGATSGQPNVYPTAQEEYFNRYEPRPIKAPRSGTNCIEDQGIANEA